MEVSWDLPADDNKANNYVIVSMLSDNTESDPIDNIISVINSNYQGQKYTKVT